MVDLGPSPETMLTPPAMSSGAAAEEWRLALIDVSPRFVVVVGVAGVWGGELASLGLSGCSLRLFCGTRMLVASRFS